MSFTFKGVWNASTNTPALSNSTGTTNDVYTVSVSGTQNLGAGAFNYIQGTSVAYISGVWVQMSIQYTGELISSGGGGGSGVTAITVSSPLTGGVITSTGTIGIPLATSVVDGYLAATDWVIFNAKQSAGNYITALTGDVTASGPGSASSTIASHAVTFAKMQQISALKLLGNSSGSTADIQEITLGTGLSFSGTTLNATGSSPLTTKGDLYTYSTTNARLPVGLDTQVLLVDSSTATGLKWGTNTAATPLGYYGAWQDDVTQTAAVDNTGYEMLFRTQDITPNGISIVNNGSGNPTRITFANTGIYNIQFSSQFQNADNAQHDVNIWLRLNGTDVPGSNGLVSIPARKAAGAGNQGHVIAGWNYVLDVVGGQYYELMWMTDDHTNVTMEFYAAGSPPPSAASVILTVTQQSGIMAGTGITAINSLTGAAQTMVSGTSGTDFGISSSGTTHSFNLPTASASNRGALSTTDWSTFNNKVTSLTGTSSRITIAGTTTVPTVDISTSYVGQATITTVGTISTGVWNGTKVDETHGGTNQSTYTTGDILYASAVNTLSKLIAGSNGQVLTLAAGIPSWATPTTGTVTSVSGTANRITSTGGATPVIDISATFEALLGKVANPLSQFAATTSAQLAGVISDETGSGSLVFATSPTLVTPALGTPSALVGTNITGTASGLTAGNATLAATASTVTLANDVANATDYLVFTNTATGNQALKTATAISVNPSTAAITATTFIGALTGNASTASSAAILTTARAIYGNNFDGSAALTQIIASTYGGTGNGFTKFTGPTSTEKTKTVRDATDTILELGGSYTPTGTWTSLTMVTPVLGTPTSGTLTNCTGLPVAGITASTSTALGVGSIELGNASDTTIARVSAGVISVEGSTVGMLPTAQTWTAQNKFNNIVDVNNAITASGNAATVPVTYRLSTVTNNSAATLTITMTTTSAVDGQLTMVRILDFSAVAQTIAWVNTENSTQTAPVTSNGSTTLPLTVGFQYNGGTSKWRCIASA